MRDIGEMIAAEALTWIGTPVRWEASVKGAGCDCRGLVAGVARALGMPEGDAIEARIGGYARRIDEAALLAGLDRVLARRLHPEPPHIGDVLAFRIMGKVQHLAICTEGDCSGRARMIHAYAGEPAQVVDVPLGRFWRARLAGIWRWREGAPQ